MQMKGKGKDLTKGSIWKTLFILAAPLVFGMAMQTLFNIVDTIFIGMLGPEELAAVSVTFPVVFIFIAIASGLMVGSTALVSQAIGAKNNKRASNIAEHSIILSLIAGVLIAICGILFSRPLFEFMGAGSDIIILTMQYINFIFVGFVFLFIGFIAQGVIQAGGDTTTPTRNLFISVVLNIILDPIFIFGFGPVPAMGLMGAAIATVLARSVGAFLNMFHIFAGKAAVRMNMKEFKADFSIIKRIIVVGLPSSVSHSINSVGMILLMSLVGVFGTSAIAAFGVGMRLESLAILPIIGLSSAVIPMVGQNLGAGNLKRARKTSVTATYAVIAFMAVFSLLWFFIPEIIFSPFSSDPDVLLIGAHYLQTIAFGYIFFGLLVIISGAFQGAGKTNLSLYVNLIRWIFVIGIAYALVTGMGLTGIWLGFPIGNLLGAILAVILFWSGLWLKGWKSNGKVYLKKKHLKL